VTRPVATIAMALLSLTFSLVMLPTHMSSSAAAQNMAPSDLKRMKRDSYLREARKCEDQGQFEKTLQYADLALAADSTCAAAYCLRGEGLDAIDKHEEALACYKKATALAPNSDDDILYLGYGACLHTLSRDKEALAVYNKGIAKATRKIQLYDSRGRLFAYLDRLPEAVDDFTAAEKINPNLWLSILARGKTYMRMKQPAKALPDFTKVIKIKPEDSNAYGQRAIIYKQLGKLDLAKADEEKANSLGFNILMPK
jgi:tetratricopeptide (TPR) repeat protein